MNIRSIKGMNDVVAPEVFLWRYCENLIRAHYENFGFSEIKTPIVEDTALFTRSVGDTTDIVQKEMYTFQDRNGDGLTLRPEGTAPVVRALVEQGLLNLDPIQKLYYWGPMFRYERPQKGRYRQFYQYGIEVFGVESAKQDAEVIAMCHTLYAAMELKDLSVQVSSLGCENCRPKYREQLVKLLTPSKQILCAECQLRLERNPMRVLDCKNPVCKEVAAVLPSMLDFLDEPCHQHFDSLRDALVLLKTPFTVNKGLVRGFDYYNRTVFEITTTQLGAQNAVGGGGRYDKLVKDLGGPDCPAVGFAGGVERLVLLLGDKLNSVSPKLPIFIVIPDERGSDLAFKTAFFLRQKGIRVELDYTGRSMKAQMKRADKLGAQFVLFVGGSEIDKGAAVLRNMATKEQQDISLSQLEDDLIRRFS